MPARLGHWQSQTSSICSKMTGQWSDRSAMLDRKTLSPPGPTSYLCGLALRIWTSFWRREDSDGMDMWNTPMVQSGQPLTYRLMESVGLGGPKRHGSSWQRVIAESGSSRPSTLMIDIPGDLVWDLPCVQQASYLEGGPLVWMLPLYLHVNQKSDYDDYMVYRIYPKYSDTLTPYHICSKIWTSTIHYPMLCLKIAGWVANSVDPDETPHSAESHLGLNCLLRPVCPNTYGKYGTSEIRRNIRKRNKTHAKAKKTGSSKLRSKFHELRQQIKADIKKQHDLYVNKLVGDIIKVNPKDFYQYTNSQRKDNHGIPPLKRRSGSDLAESETEQAEEFSGQCTMDAQETNVALGL